MRAYNLLMKAVAPSLCRDHSCEECRAILGLSGSHFCPDDLNVTKDEANEYVARVLDRLESFNMEHVFDDPPVTEDEFENALLEILKEEA